MAAALMLLGALLLIAGAACFSVPAALIVAGVVLLGAGLDMASDKPAEPT